MAAAFDLIQGRFESHESPEDMININLADGATPEIAAKRAGYSLIELTQDVKDENKWKLIVTHKDDYKFRLSFVFGEPQSSLKHGQPVQVVYILTPPRPGDTVVTVTATFTGVDNRLAYILEYFFVPEGLLMIRTSGNLRGKRWYRRLANK